MLTVKRLAMCSTRGNIHFFFKVFLSDTFTCPILGPLVPLFWISKPEWVLPYSHCGGKCNVHFLRSTSGATHCQPLDGQHCGAPTGFISCPRILLCGSSECRALTIRPRVPVPGTYITFASAM